MGGNRAAYASTTATRQRVGGDGGGVHSVRSSQPTRLGTNQEPYANVDDDDNDNDGGRSGANVSSTPKQNGFKAQHEERALSNDADEYDDDADGDYDDDDEDDDEAAEREREMEREREEMRQQFTFKEHKRRNLRNDIMGAMRRKRRMLMRNENLRFRELYKPPEPMVVLTVVTMVTIVSLILTKSWPFY